MQYTSYALAADISRTPFQQPNHQIDAGLTLTVATVLDLDASLTIYAVFAPHNAFNGTSTIVDVLVPTAPKLQNFW